MFVTNHHTTVLSYYYLLFLCIHTLARLPYYICTLVKSDILVAPVHAGSVLFRFDSHFYMKTLCECADCWERTNKGYSLQCGNGPLLCLLLKTVGKRKIRRTIGQFRCYQILAKPLTRYRPLTFCTIWWSKSLSCLISSGSYACLKSEQHCHCCT